VTPATLQALRRLLFFSVPEAAALIGGVTERSWRLWEDGGRPVPEDVADTILALIAWRAQAIATASAALTDLQARHGPASGAALVWYARLDDWATLPGREPAQWRPHCSACAEMVARHGARLVEFDGPVYAAWLGKRKDSEAMRGAWAARR